MSYSHWHVFCVDPYTYVDVQLKPKPLLHAIDTVEYVFAPQN